MSTLNDAISRNVLDTQHQQQKEENTHTIKNEHTSTQKDKHRKRHEKKKISSSCVSPSTSFTTTNSSSNSSISTNNNHISNIALATQFSIQRTDSDGCLRMKISAIRPTTTVNVAKIKNSNAAATTKGESKLLKTTTNSSEAAKLKISPPLPPPPPVATVSTKQQDKHNKKAEEKTKSLVTPNMSVIINPYTTKEKHDLPLSLIAKTMVCHSDATDSGCSEATNTTTATTGQEVLTKRKVKRKKSLLKGLNEAGRPLQTMKSLTLPQINAFSTDSEDEPLSKHKLIPNVATITQRAPRLLLTALGVKSGATGSSHTNFSSALQTGGSDHIGLSSSDNELPNVRAAIARVVGESDEDDEDNILLSHFPKAKSKKLQYQSTLLQDFMEKSQSAGHAPTTSTDTSCSQKYSQPSQIEILAQVNTNSQSDSIASSSASAVNKKRRGRPKKQDKPEDLSLNSMSPLINVHNKVSNVNESADSGVISTTSISTQSTSPHPCMTLASGNDTASLQSPNKSLNETLEKLSSDTAPSCSTSKPKIDIALLDKRMYATERVLYPPPRNKRRQSMNAALASVSDKRNVSLVTQSNPPKEDVQLDPVWRKIDVNRKFRRPSVCSTTGYKSDGGMADDRVKDRSSKSTVCSKVLAAKSGYVSDYGSSSFRASKHSKHSHNSGYKSDASCKSRYSTKSCASRKSRAKSCGYRSDCKESLLSNSKSSKFRRKRRASIMQKSMGSLKDEQDILQLAGLSLGQSSEESNEYVCKPSLEKLPTTSASKKYGEINRYIATGEYFGRGSSGSHHSAHKSFASISNSNQAKIFDLSAASNLPQTPAKIALHQRKNSTTSEFAHDLLQLPGSNHAARKIKSRRSSVASYCSSFYSVGTTKMRKRKRRKLFRFHNSSSNKNAAVDSKLLTEIEILTNTFTTRCRIQGSSISDKLASGNLSQKEKLMAEATKLQQSLAAQAASTSLSAANKRDSRDKRTLKKRKMSENLVDFAMLSARAEGNAMTPSSTGQGSTSKRRHKKASSSSPDDHKLPLKKRHYLLTPGEKSSEVAVAVAAKLFANNAEAWAAAAATAKSTANTKSQQQFNARTAKANLTPKKRHLLQQQPHHPHTLSEDSNSNKTPSTMSPLRVAVGGGDASSISGGKLLDISPQSLNSLKQVTEAVNKKRSRLEGLVSRIATNHVDDISPLTCGRNKTPLSSTLQIESESSSCPPPGIFEPSIELEIQIPPMAKLPDSSTGIITKSEVDSPMLLDLNKGFPDTIQKTNGQRVVESLLNKTGGNLILKRKRKKINRTGFPTVRRKKRKILENLLLDVQTDVSEDLQHHSPAPTALPTNVENVQKSPPKKCDRVPQEGETSQTFLERNNRTPRLSVVALERLQESPLSNKDNTNVKEKQIEPPTTPKSRPSRREIKRKIEDAANRSAAEVAVTKKSEIAKITSAPKADSIVGKPLVSKTSKRAELSKTINANVDVKVINSRLLKKSICSKSEALLEDEDDKPLLSRSRRSQPIKEIKDARRKSPVLPSIPVPVRKNVISKTVRSLLDANIKLPAGIDPSSLLSCKIKLKRRNSIHPLALVPKSTAPIIQRVTEAVRTPEQIDRDANSKDCNTDFEEQDVLPLHESIYNVNGDTEHSDTSEEKSSSHSASSFSKKVKVAKKSYLPAGIFSDYFKTTQMSSKKPYNKKDTDKKSMESEKAVDTVEEKDNEIVRPMLPPPPYCEKYLRRTQTDFELPYDIWWAYTNSKLPSRITVASWNFRKIRTNIYAENVKPPPIAGYDHPLCNCKPDVGCADNCLNRMVYTECSPSNCPTRDKCRNQKIQRHEIAPGVERFMTENKGWGVRTKLPIIRGTYILEYVGEVVTEREFKDRMATIYLNDTHHYCLHLDGGLVIDGHRMGSDCRFVNHSCEPNCEIQKWSVNGLSRMALFAKCNIKDGEELTYDYNFSLFNPSEGQPCRCNTPHCRGVIGGKSQRVKPLPIEVKTPTETTTKDAQKGRQRKRKAKKNTQRQHTKDVATPTRMQPLSEKEKKLVKQYSIFLMRNFEKIRSRKLKRKDFDRANDSKPQTPVNTSTPSTSPSIVMPAAISQRRPSTPASLVAQITALCTARNMKTRGLTLAVQDPELDKMAKMAKVLRDICTNLEIIRNPDNEQQSLVAITVTPTTVGGNKKKKTSVKHQQKMEAIDFKGIQGNIEQGLYKLPEEFNIDMTKLLTQARKSLEKNEPKKLYLVELLEKSFEEQKQEQHSALLEILGDESMLQHFQKPKNTTTEIVGVANMMSNPDIFDNSTPTEDIIRCICGLFKDEGLMIQCARCMVWQHTECTKADINADNYHCERCESRVVDREIPLEDFTDEGHRYYLTLMRGTDLQVRQGDAVYVLRDIPVRDTAGNVVPSKKHTYKTIGEIDYNECDIFRVERLWKDEKGKRFIFGHHFLRPHETFHEPSRKFYPNEVVRVPLYEVVPIDLVIGRCWVLDRTTFCKGRPIECNDEAHCYICELRVDKSARFFSRAKTNHPTCTKCYAFRKFNEKLRISKTYAPHEVDPALLKTKKQKTDNECQNIVSNSQTSTTNGSLSQMKQETNKQSQASTKKRQSSKSPATIMPVVAAASPKTPVTTTTVKEKRTHLETVLKNLKTRYKQFNFPTTSTERPLDLTYLLTGRGARRKTPIATRKDFV